MATVITARESVGERLPKVLLKILPPSVSTELYAMYARGIPIDEIRLRVGRAASVTSGGRNIPLGTAITREQADEMVDVMCESSLYAHADTINCGYLTLEGGIRVGVVGRAVLSGERIIGVYDISSLCFRLPRRNKRVGAPVCRLLRQYGGERGVLVYSPPGHGKTTLLRSVSAMMSSGEDAWRVLVIDTRGELGFSLDEPFLCLDVLSGYPKATGIEIAARSMNAQLIICDEIGDPAEAEAIIGAQNCGVPLLATAHASSLEGLLLRPGIRRLHEACVFGAYVGIRRYGNEKDYTYTVNTHKEADDFFEDMRCTDDSAQRRVECLST